MSSHPSHHKNNLKSDSNLSNKKDFTVALAGNPNTGKTTVFNSITGLHQHTGNWPGKTVANSKGNFTYKDKDFTLVDLPGTYSLMASSVEEEIARDFLCFGKIDTVIIVIDSTCIERNLNLVFQILEITPKVVVCLNLIDEATKKGISIDIKKLSSLIGVPVIPTAARSSLGIHNLKSCVYSMCNANITTNPIKLKYNDVIEDFISTYSPKLKQIFGDTINCRWLALRLLDGDTSILNSIKAHFNEIDKVK